MYNNEYAVWQWQNSVSALLPLVYNILRASESGKWPQNGLIRLYVKMLWVYLISPFKKNDFFLFYFIALILRTNTKFIRSTVTLSYEIYCVSVILKR